jgi:hypothetical protein
MMIRVVCVEGEGEGGDWSKFQGGRGKEGPDSVHILLLGRKKVIISNGLDIENSRNILMQRVETKWGWGMGGKHVIEQDADMHMVVATISTSLQSQIKTMLSSSGVSSDKAEKYQIILGHPQNISSVLHALGKRANFQDEQAQNIVNHDCSELSSHWFNAKKDDELRRQIKKDIEAQKSHLGTGSYLFR